MPPLWPVAVAAGYEEGSAMTEKRAGLSAMTLKYIAMATMLVDHMGYVLFPWILWLRCVGRIAFPIFAFQIAEGCIRTHDRRRYALRLLLFAVLIWRLMVISIHARDLGGALIAGGIMGHIALQVILNIAVVTNTIPNTGITLPFISYGGTSVLFLLGEMGLALSVSRDTD